ncbi:olfactory receptor 51V1-like [Tachyglossus aculeatus]|uniref:olfactory receptor 51V1-like n=1 Tax=Tachyglossus aculeatus TaxID=9261 RepID=UPI0018F4D02E|nr:olfactory receptor 51V1-like [Tachyglossus aculeatus]
MSALHPSNFNTSSFQLLGFPGLESAYPWIALPLSTIYTVVLLGNSTILYVLWVEQSLHEPMYYLLALLTTTDFGMGLSTLPTVLGVLWGHRQEISLNSCIAQAYFIHGLSIMESGVLLVMSWDRFIAICNPLRYTSLVTGSSIIKIGSIVLTRSWLLTLPVIIRLRFLFYCRPHVLSHSFCLHQDLLRLTCSDTRFNSFYALGLVIIILVLDSVLILASYILIFRTVLTVASRGERLKSLQTCTSHILAILVFYVPIIGLTMVHRFGKHLTPLVHVLMGHIYILFPPLMNPIIYSIKTQQIRKRIRGMFYPERS